VGSYTAEGGVGLATASVDPATGTLTVGPTVPDVPDASWLARSADGRYLYATNEREPTGSVTALDLADHPVVLNRQSTEGGAPTHLSVHPSGRYLLTANYGSGSVAVLPLSAAGRLGPLTDLVRHKGNQPHAHQIVTDPGGEWVLAVDLGDDSVYVYQLDLATGKLHLADQVTVATGSGPRHLLFHPSGRRAYLVCEYSSQVIVCEWDPQGGKLTTGQIIGTVPPGGVTPNFPAEGVVAPDGRFLYVTNRGDNSIAVFAVHGDRIALLGTTPCGGDWPRHATLDPAGQRLYVSNQRSGTVAWLPRDPASGLLSPAAGTAKAAAVAMVLFA
jgi:6-phosphogluconolactonase (cycloisomerase 2 family)